MCPTREFFNTFLEVRGLPEPNGQRLNEYGCRGHEYRNLRELLLDHGDPEHLRVQHDGPWTAPCRYPGPGNEMMQTM